MSDLIRPEELYQKLSGDQPPVVIDVRGKAAYTAGHIPNALHIPEEEIATRMVEIPENRFVVTY
jgi:rhodanese-related sulfurtransferase